MTKKINTRTQDHRLKHVMNAMRRIRTNGIQSADRVLTADQLQASQQAIQEAVAHVQRSRSRRLPTHFNFAGGRFSLAYSILGRVFICDQQGNRLLASGYDVI